MNSNTSTLHQSLFHSHPAYIIRGADLSSLESHVAHRNFKVSLPRPRCKLFAYCLLDAVALSSHVKIAIFTRKASLVCTDQSPPMRFARKVLGCEINA